MQLMFMTCFGSTAASVYINVWIDQPHNNQILKNTLKSWILKRKLCGKHVIGYELFIFVMSLAMLLRTSKSIFVMGIDVSSGVKQNVTGFSTPWNIKYYKGLRHN